MEQPNNSTHRRRSLRGFSFFTVALALATILYVGATSFSSLLRTEGSLKNSRTHPADVHFDHFKRTDNSPEGWHKRALARPTPKYTPKKADLAFTATQSTLIGTQFTLALFKPSYAVDAAGKVLQITTLDFIGFETWIQQVAALPAVSWSVAHNITDYPVDILKTPAGLRASVYGWDPKTDVLNKPTAGYTRLPTPLQSLIGLARESWEGTNYSSPRNQTLINQILAF